MNGSRCSASEALDLLKRVVLLGGFSTTWQPKTCLYGIKSVICPRFMDGGETCRRPLSGPGCASLTFPSSNGHSYICDGSDLLIEALKQSTPAYLGLGPAGHHVL